MTHITEGIQEDSLKVLDILLEQYPALITGRSSILLKNFVELISHQQLSKGLVNRDRSQSWILSVNPNRRLTSQQWRLKVLVRLSKFLQALADGSSRLRESEGLQEQKENPHATSNSIFINWKEHANDQQHIQVYENGGSQPNVSSQFRLRYLVGGLGSMDEGLSSTENLKGFIEIIIPLLIECWIEAVPPQPAAALGSGVEREPLQVMQQVLNIISLLWKLTKQHDETHKLTVCHNLLVIPARSQSFDILQSAISKHLVGLTVIPDSTAGCVLGVMCKLLDHTCVLSESLLPFLASCCYSLFYFLLTLEKGEAEHLRKRDKLWGVCVSMLALLPRVLRLMLQSLRVNRAGPEELPVVGQLLRLLLQHAPLRTHMLTNAILVQQIIKNITTLKSGGVQEQWLTDLHYCFNMYITGHPQGPSALSTVY
ncbi:hypothetical protein CB1_000794015 [Camelus ferus]|nr:hypothetical protein CB1_000794015 [Camelus ferus]